MYSDSLTLYIHSIYLFSKYPESVELDWTLGR